MNENSLDRSPTENLLDLNLDKDTWIYTYGSSKLQQVRSFGYECEDRYLQERLKSEYPGYRINRASVAKKLDLPPLYAIKESLKWNDAYVAKQYSQGEVIAIDRYLGKYQIIKKTAKPWYLTYNNIIAIDENDPKEVAFYAMLTIIFFSPILAVIILK
ncbi:hypothetical protein [Chamaesiphon sp. OTE_20_metabat_361]|uniref:hypothetical protein n=1 Tax=Chamaesiphon sp. OTE_20_metabat_361 TaxID=2964689 RepID=UPI00286AEAE5|nr:hypothetical protein [Chamaesiphon sp. OTE_20_metabat_361]